jgi:hypothetical protein
VVGDLGYIGAAHKAYCRQRWDSAVVTHRRADQALVPPFETEREVYCHQGQPLRWLGYDPTTGQHWFGRREPLNLCACCWQASTCLHEFVYDAATQETLLGRLPLSTRAAQTLLKGVRSWIEASQSFEKNQLGLSHVFLNSLRFAWCAGLLSDAVLLLRAHALLEQARSRKGLLTELAPTQLVMELR